MGRSGRGQAQRRKTVDLSGTFSLVEKEQLVNLMSTILEKMSQKVSNLFDSQPDSRLSAGSFGDAPSQPEAGPLRQISGQNAQNGWNKIAARATSGKGETRAGGPPMSTAVDINKKENMGPRPAAASTSTAAIAVNHAEQSSSADHETLDKEEKENEQLAELKKEAVAGFKKWQATVLQRVRDISVSEVPVPIRNVDIPVGRGRGRGDRGDRAGRGRGDSFRGGRGRGGRGGRGQTQEPAAGPVREPPPHEVDPALRQHYAPTATSLWRLRKEKRELLLHGMLLLLLSLEEYTAYSRVLLLNLTSSLHLPLCVFQEDEVRVAQGLGNAVADLPKDLVSELPDKLEPFRGTDVGSEEDTTCGGAMPDSSDDSRADGHGAARGATSPNRNSTNNMAANGARNGGATGGRNATAKNGDASSRKWKMGLAGAAGGAIIGGMTGGVTLPASLVAAGVGSVIGGLGLGATAAAGLLGTLAETGMSLGTMFGMYHNRPAAKTLEQFSRDIQDFALLPMHGEFRSEYRNPRDIVGNDRRLRLVICISGWVTEKCDLVDPWRCLGHQAEVYAVRWELAALVSLGNSLETVIKSNAWRMARNDIASRSSLKHPLWPLNLLRISKIIDNPWNVGMVRAEKAGLIMADAIMRHVQGNRPISLVGYSLGARTIYTCLMILAERRHFGLIDSVVMIGTPAPSDHCVWLTLRSVVAGRLVNVYSEKDYMLAFMLRTSNTQYGVAGLEPIRGAGSVENYDVGDLNSGHLRYQYMVSHILRDIGWEDLDGVQAAHDGGVLAAMDGQWAREARRKEELFRGGHHAGVRIDADREAVQMLCEVRQKNEAKKGQFAADELVKEIGKLKIQN